MAVGMGTALMSGASFLGEAMKPGPAGPALSGETYQTDAPINVNVGGKPLKAEDYLVQYGLWIAGGLLALKLITDSK